MNQGGDMDVRISKLREDIETINKIDDDAWKETLSQRKLAELEFHDRDRDRKSFESIGCRETALTMVFKLVIAAQKKWQRLNGRNELPKLIQGVRFEDGIEVNDKTGISAA